MSRSLSQRQVQEDQGELAEPSEDGDVIYQLGEKIRVQAKRLTALEQYKLLCERRISDLSPGHPFPVKQEHLGMEGLGVQLHQAHQKIARLEQELAQGGSPSFGTRPTDDVQTLLYDRASLEESLRTEILHSEEQRALIEALRQALESKMEQLGLEGDVDVMAGYAKAQEQIEVLKRDNGRLKGVVSDQQSTIDSLKEETQAKEMRVDDLETELTEIQGHVDAGSTANQQLEAIVEELTTEKTDLVRRLEMVSEASEQQKQAISKLETELESMKNQHLGLQRQHQEAHSTLTVSETRAKQLSDQRERLLTETATAQLISTQNLEALEAAQKKAREQQVQIHTLTEQLSDLRAKSEAFQTAAAAQTSSNRSIQQTLDQAQADLASALNQKAYFQSALNGSKQEIGEREATEYRLKGEIKELQRTVQTLREESAAAGRAAQDREAELLRKIEGVERAKTDLESALDRTKETHSRTQEELADSLKRTENDYFQQIQAMETELKRAETELKNRSEANETDTTRLKSQIISLKDEVSKAKEAREQSNSELKEQRNQWERSEESRRLLVTELQDLGTQLSTSKAALTRQQQLYKSLQDDLEAVSAAFEKAKTDYSDLETDYEAVIEENQQLKANLEALNADLETVTRNVVEMSKDLEESRAQEKSVSARISDMENVLNRAETELQTGLEEMKRLLQPGSKTAHPTSGGPKSDSGFSLLPLISSFSELIPIARNRVLSDQKSLQALQTQLSITVSAQSASSQDQKDLSTALRNLTDEKSDLLSEVQTLRETVATERKVGNQQLEEMNKEMLGLERQLQRAVEELQEHRERLRKYAQENSDLQRENVQVQIQMQKVEGKMREAVGEKRRFEQLLNRFLTSIPAASGLKRLVLDIVQVRNDMSNMDRTQEVTRNRIQDLEAEALDRRDDFELQKALQNERNGLIRGETEIENLQQRLTLLERELTEAQTNGEPRQGQSLRETLKETPIQPTQALAKNKDFTSMKTVPDSSRTDPQYRVVRYDPRISPYLSESIKSRLSDSKGGERLMQTAPDLRRVTKGSN